MPTPNRPASQNKYPEQYIQNTSFDEDFGVQTFEPLGFDGQNLQRLNANNFAVKIVESGGNTYIGKASPGTSETTPKWQSKKIDNTGTTTWADGDANFDNVVNDIINLSYS